ncbi:choline dehydrogenase-like flavoprotein [Tepidamorphus gemmatus]|uniref:Choline dehydrogenase-like flavoprotein n=1 Tax=Tepidamorphus gemmatus TaxID=747076 RepID=A0A4R3MDA4_9HYPH|nr:GMC family oxidoreductase [Tepidamorphus gemmatus]TCT10037.1 choline dehydrogenase-like flavoprotein [Tepidamorphus gemmatus]
MIIDLDQFETSEAVVGGVCIVGAGPAGITLALELAARGRDVILLESGGRSYEDATQALYHGEVIGQPNTDVGASRLRQFGGTSGHWTGLCAPLDPIDFEARAGVPHSGWPIGRADLDPYYETAQTYLELGPFRYDFADWKDRLPSPALPLDPALVETAIYQQSPPTRFAETYWDPIARNDRIRCILHANLVDILLVDDAVAHFEFASLGGHRLRVRAGAYVIACGGIENARILLNCRKQRPAGIGNEHDLVGRYFMDHLNCEVGAILFAEDDIDLALYDQVIDSDGAALQIGLKLPAATMRREGLLNNTAFLVPEYENAAFSDDFRGHGWVSFSTMVKAFSRGRIPDRFAENYCNAVEDAGSIAVGAYRHVMRRFVPAGRAIAAKLRQDAEQSPNPDSRVLLIDEQDPFGWRRIALDWRIQATDYDSLRRTHEAIGQAVGAAGLGRVQIGITDPPDLDLAYTGYHHMGTTRMHDSPRRGVVDRNCRLHSVNNLYMAGSSVFTTGGTANPTLTIVALAARLADHLATSVTAQLRI